MTAAYYTPPADITQYGATLRIDQKLPSPLRPDSNGAGVYPVGGRSSTPTVTFTRPANTTAYTALDVIGSTDTANHQATSAGVAGSLIQIVGASLTINNTSLPSGMSGFRLHLFDASPAAIADNAAFAAAAAERSKYRGWVDLATPTVIGGGFLFTFGDYIGRPLRLVTTGFFFNLQTISGYTPASGTEYIVRFNCVEVGA